METNQMNLQNRIMKLVHFLTGLFCIGALFVFSGAAQSQNAGAQGDALLKAGHSAYNAKNYALAQQKYEASASLGNSRAMMHLGENFYYGLGVAKNYIRAKQWFEESAKRGEAKAMGYIGMIYGDGQGVDRDQKLALRWLEEAAKRDDAFGMMRLGFAYHEGLGVAKNYEIAMRWYQEAAKRGNSSAMNNIGNLFNAGAGVKEDACVANSWYRRSLTADSDNGNVLVNLGSNLWRGRCGPPDKQQARKLLNLAESLGNSDARRELAAMDYVPRKGHPNAGNECDYVLSSGASYRGRIDDHGLCTPASGN
jgi:TPR repeat protein